jgi:hypothetical protein
MIMSAHGRPQKQANGGITWSHDEDAMLREHYPKSDGMETLRAMMPWRTVHAIRRHASDVGIQGPHRSPKMHQYVIHDCGYCGNPIPTNGLTGYVYNRKKTCCKRCAMALAYKTKVARGTLVTKKRDNESPQLVEALLARDRGDHTLLREILNG